MIPFTIIIMQFLHLCLMYLGGINVGIFIHSFFRSYVSDDKKTERINSIILTIISVIFIISTSLITKNLIQ